jgi:hypothetical protein
VGIGGRHGMQTRGPHPQPAPRQRRNFLLQSSLVQPWVQISEPKSREEKTRQIKSRSKFSSTSLVSIVSIVSIGHVARYWWTETAMAWPVNLLSDRAYGAAY